VQPWHAELEGMDVMEWPSVASETEFQQSILMGPASAAADVAGMGAPSAPALRGLLQGAATADLAHLQDALAQHGAGKPFVIDCSGLVRLDFAAGGKLLQWLLSTMARGVQVELVGVNRLVAAFFHVVGIDEAVTVRLREY
jgi:anti-anti-sigma regulatory factor